MLTIILTCLTVKINYTQVNNKLELYLKKPPESFMENASDISINHQEISNLISQNDRYISQNKKVSIEKVKVTKIPNQNFEHYLETHDENGKNVDIGSKNSLGDGIINNNLVFTSRISSVTDLIISNKNIENINGIEDFVQLKHLNISNNSITDIDLSKNLMLESLIANENKIRSIVLETNHNLREVNLNENNLKQIYISNLLNLIKFSANDNELIEINLNKNINLTDLHLQRNQLKEIDLKK